jgi:hypothetical protein
MRARLPLFLDELTLEEVLSLEDELSRRKEKHRRNYSVLVVQADRPILRSDNGPELSNFTRHMRRYMSGSAAVGSGTLLAFSPEASVLLFTSVAGACRTCGALLNGLPELNGHSYGNALHIQLKLGLATGVDTIAPGSSRSVRQSGLVKRANEAAWRSAPNEVLLDESSFVEWPEKSAVAPAPFDMNGQHVYRAVPGLLGRGSGKYDNDALLRFLRRAAEVGIPTLKYNVRHKDVGRSENEQDDSRVPMMEVTLEAYDPEHESNLTFKEDVVATDLNDRIEVLKRILAAMGLALVRYELDRR